MRYPYQLLGGQGFDVTMDELHLTRSIKLQ